MVSSLIKLNLGSLLICIVISCSNNTGKESTQLVKPLIDTCKDLRKYTGSFILSDAGCSGCHFTGEKRIFSDIPTFAEVAATDSLKLSDYLFKTKHGSSYKLVEQALF